MSQPPEPTPRVPHFGRFRVGDWSVYQTENVLGSEGRFLRLEPRVMDVLVYLAARPGTVVPKEELLEAVWGGAFVEEGALSQAIHGLRRALGDDARQPRYIQTIPKRGYLLLAAVEPEAQTGTASRSRADLSSSSAALVTVPAQAPWSPWKSRRLLAAAAVLLAAVALPGLWLVRDRLVPEGSAEPTAEGRKKIVVLPFENIGKPDDDFFADGLTEEITKDLSAFRTMQVTSRTTAMMYEGERKPVPEIARELRVDYVLEGTVRWAKGVAGKPRVRITPQLIRAADDTHIWAESFEREVEDIFEVQEEISRRVIGALDVALVPGEAQRPRRSPPKSLDAYRAYVRGLQHKNQPFYSEEHLLKAVSMFERAVELDPEYAVAWAELSQTDSYLAFNSDPSPARVEKARESLDRALALAPDLPEVRVAQAYFTYRCAEDFDAALGQLSTAARLFPNDAGVLETLGFVLRRKGRLVEAIRSLEDASALNPKSVNLVWTIGETERALRNFEQADQHYRQAISRAPDEAFFWEERALNQVAWKGDFEGARAILEEAPPSAQPALMSVGFQLDFQERKYERALARLSGDWVKRLPPQEQSYLAMLGAIARERLGDRESALEAAGENRAELEARIARYPKEPSFRAYLAVALAQLGRRAEALDQAEQAVLQKRHDAFSGPPLVEIQAMVDAMLGRRREAIDRLSSLLDLHYRSSLTSARLRLDPVWDPLRGDPAFARLLRRFELTGPVGSVTSFLTAVSSWRDHG